MGQLCSRSDRCLCRGARGKIFKSSNFHQEYNFRYLPQPHRSTRSINRNRGRVVMALASGIPVDTAMYYKLSASGAIRVGSSPTDFIILLLFARGRAYPNETERGQAVGDVCQTIRSFQVSSRPTDHHALIVLRNERPCIHESNSQTWACLFATIVPFTAVYSHEIRHDLYATVVLLVTSEVARQYGILNSW
jgi:hypothetical protein